MIEHQQQWTNTHHSFLKVTAESLSNALLKEKYEKEELLGNKPNILQSHWHDKKFYTQMW